ncbi:hypothetical protein EVAR_95484_1 [Eumeta japonica]|uniref:Uncharacterized protein n=1 Tax=Eumeta variegata TaxID=151549 RepID=A0A4C1UIK8_EUMVA|nr:hypothetical protein EVAR_95484_1 [Eumeta japonica]
MFFGIVIEAHDPAPLPDGRLLVASLAPAEHSLPWAYKLGFGWQAVHAGKPRIHQEMSEKQERYAEIVSSRMKRLVDVREARKICRDSITCMKRLIDDREARKICRDSIIPYEKIGRCQSSKKDMQR